MGPGGIKTDVKSVAVTILAHKLSNSKDFISMVWVIRYWTFGILDNGVV